MKENSNKALEKSAKIINKTNRFVAVFLAVLFILYGGFSLWDMYRSEFRAFASFDLLQYKPVIEDEPPYLEELSAINPDVCSWLTLYNTRIDYPVVQGKEDMEYVNKDASGNYAMWGSLFVSQLNKNDYSDPYTLVYGHHVNNGTMFGDIEKYKDKQFFDINKEGVMVLPEIIYDLKAFSFLETDAYDEVIYNPNKTSIKTLKNYLKEKAEYYEDIDTDKVVAFSTCSSNSTNGRMVLFCSMTEREKPYSRYEEPETVQRQAVGHSMAGAYWAVLNMICMIFTVYTAFPLHLARKKKWKSKEFIIESCIALISIAVFYITEDPHKPMQITDKWTPVMIILLFSCWYISAKKNKIFPKEKGDKS